MEIEILGYVMAVLVGLTLGLLGGGGSILCVPILFYIFKLPSETATAYSLFVVGVSSIAGTFKYLEAQLVSIRAFLLFGIPASLSVWFNRSVVIRKIPDPIFGTIDKDFFIMVLFATMMILAARIMIKGRGNSGQTKEKEPKILLVILVAIIVGFLTSLVGAGGGFVIIPVLVKLFNMPIKKAIGTSLSLIMTNSLIGFSGDVSSGMDLDWLFLMKFTGLAVVGIFTGIFISKSIPAGKLKRIFGWFVLFMGILILTERIIQSYI